MTKADPLRLERLQLSMMESGIDLLILRLPENIVYVSEYWPILGHSFAVLSKEGRPLLFPIEVETEHADPDWAEVKPFGWGRLKDKGLYESYRDLLGQLGTKLGLSKAKIGIEKSFDVTGPAYCSAEQIVLADPWWKLVEAVFPETQLVDVTSLLQISRAIKTSYQLEKMRIANEIAEMGMREFLTRLEPGMTEFQVGAMVEYKIRSEGPGYKGARFVRASAEVGAGPVGSTACSLLVPSTTRMIQEGDLVMVELGTVVDGYWSDLTYMAVAGQPSQKQKDIYNTVLEAQQAACIQMSAGNCSSVPDGAARDVLRKAGLDSYFIHITGHGIGLRYHESIPILMPGSVEVLQEGMVSSVEPGVYIKDWGGIRIEDNVAVGKHGPVFLSTPRRPW